MTTTKSYRIALHGQPPIQARGAYHVVTNDESSAPWFYVKDADHKVTFGAPSGNVLYVETVPPDTCETAGHVPDKIRWVVAAGPGGMFGPDADVPSSFNPCARCGVWMAGPPDA